jgi:hypothetical protein
MARTRASAKTAGTRFERQIADALAQALDDDRIERRARYGTKDRGDIAGIRIHGQRVVIECKDTCETRLPRWTRQAEPPKVRVTREKRAARKIRRIQAVSNSRRY